MGLVVLFVVIIACIEIAIVYYHFDYSANAKKINASINAKIRLYDEQLRVEIAKQYIRTAGEETRDKIDHLAKKQ